MSEEAYRRFRGWEICIAISGCVSMLMVGVAMTWPSPLTAWYYSKNSEVPMTEHEVSWLVSIVAIGSGVASIPCGMLADKFGRKKILTAVGISSAMCWLLIMFTRSKWTLYTAQILGGLVVGGGFSVTPMYISEISPPKIRGAIIGQLNTMYFTGQLLVYTAGSQLSYTNYIRVCFSIPIIFFLFFFFAPESPYYLISKGRDEEAKECMVKLHGKKSLADLEASKKQSQEKESLEKPSIWKALNTDNHMKHMIYLQILSGVNMLNGTSSLSIYAMEFLGGEWVAVEMAVIYIVTSFLSAFLADRVGRRPLLMASLVGGAIFTSLLAVYFIWMEKILLHVGLFGFCFITSIGINPFILTLPSELFPTSLRAFANGLTQLTTGLFGFICLKIFVNINESIGIWANFVLYTIFSLIGTLVGYLLPETAKSVMSAA